MLVDLKTIIYKPLSFESAVTASMQDSVCIVEDKKNNLEAHCLSVGDKLFLQIASPPNEQLLLVALEYLLGHNPELNNIEIKSGNATTSLNRAQFFQKRSLWHKEATYNPTVENWIETNERLHPVRPAKDTGTVYSRYIPHLEKTFSFRVIDPILDLDTFHDWHNQPRVANFWELKLPKYELLQYIESSLQDPHTLPMIAEFDGVAVGYFEMYWTREDRLAPYYESDVFDRGFHFLIGNKDFLGFQNTDAVLKSLTHFLFLDEIRTRKLMAEPRSDNKMVLRYIDTFKAWKKLYEFDFPHKRAALLQCTREAFFMGSYL